MDICSSDNCSSFSVETKQYEHFKLQRFDNRRVILLILNIIVIAEELFFIYKNSIIISFTKKETMELLANN